MLLREILQVLDPRPGMTVVDCTVGWAGHSAELLTSVGPGGLLIGLDLDAANCKVVFAGDSPNDAPMFAFFENAVGVGNVRRFPGLQPKYVTGSDAGAGFAELVAHLLEAP